MENKLIIDLSGVKIECYTSKKLDFNKKDIEVVIHDNRESISREQAFDILWNGHSVLICDLPDFSVEDEGDIYDPGHSVLINDILSVAELLNQSKEKSKKDILDYLVGYEIYK